MNIKPFKVEKWMNEFEDSAIYNLGETCIDSLTVKGLVGLCGEDLAEHMANVADTRLSYGNIYGSPDLKNGIAGLYESIAPDDVIVTHGAIGANYQVINTIIEPHDNMVCVMPTYQQHYSIPESIGAQVRIIKLSPENGFLPDIAELESLVDKNTKVITINNPNNPSGSWIPPQRMRQIAEIAERAGAYVLCDEVYRGISEDGSYMESITDLYDKGISVGSMSKIFSMAGLRLGWIATKDLEVRQGCLDRRDYDTISCGVLDDYFAALALKHKDKIIARNRAIIEKNRAILDEWVRQTPNVSYQRPVAGTTALVYYKGNITSYELAVRLIREKGVLVTPGYCFELENCLRVGYAYDSVKLRQGLDLIAEVIKSL